MSTIIASENLEWRSNNQHELYLAAVQNKDNEIVALRGRTEGLEDWMAEYIRSEEAYQAAYREETNGVINNLKRQLELARQQIEQLEESKEGRLRRGYSHLINKLHKLSKKKREMIKKVRSTWS